MFDSGGGAVAVDEVVPPSDEVIAAELAQQAANLNAVNGRLVELVAEVLDRGMWKGWDLPSPQAWVAYKLGISLGKAAEYVRIARRHTELPVTTAALAAGEITIDAAAVIAAKAPASHEESVCRVAHHATLAPLKHMVGRYWFGTRPGTTPPEANPGPGPDQSVIWFGAVDEDRWKLRADLPIDEGRLIEQALTAAHNDLFGAGRDGLADGETPPEVTWADALGSLAEHYLAAGAAAVPGADRYRILMHLEAAPDQPDALVGRWHLGPPIPPGLRRYLCCDSHLTPIITINGVPLATAASQPSVPRRLRRLVEDRDGGCRTPGCTTRRFLAIHHIVHREDGSPTTLDNLTALCRRHHRLHHLGQLGITGDATNLAFTDHNSRPITPTEPRPPNNGPDPPPPYQHPPGGTYRTVDVWFQPNHPPDEPDEPDDSDHPQSSLAG